MVLYDVFQGKSELYKLLFTLTSMADGRRSSFLVANTAFTTFAFELPSPDVPRACEAGQCAAHAHNSAAYAHNSAAYAHDSAA